VLARFLHEFVSSEALAVIRLENHPSKLLGPAKRP
jgi:hypothetical protein